MKRFYKTVLMFFYFCMNRVLLCVIHNVNYQTDIIRRVVIITIIAIDRTPISKHKYWLEIGIGYRRSEVQIIEDGRVRDYHYMHIGLDTLVGFHVFVHDQSSESFNLKTCRRQLDTVKRVDTYLKKTFSLLIL